MYLPKRLGAERELADRLDRIDQALGKKGRPGGPRTGE
jgi:hypothetical protein